MIILRQKEFNSRAQKEIREKWEVLKPQEYWKKVNAQNYKDAEEAMKRGIENNNPVMIRLAEELEARTQIQDSVINNIQKSPDIIKNDSGLQGIDYLTNEQRHLNKKMTREGVEDFEEWQRRGGVKGRAERVEKKKKATRGVKKVRGQKNPEGNTKSMKDRIWNLSPKRREEVFRREEERAKILKEEARKERELYFNDKARKLKALKKASIKKSIKKAAPWVIGGTLATAGTVAGVKAYKKHKKDKEK